MKPLSIELFEDQKGKEAFCMFCEKKLGHVNADGVSEFCTIGPCSEKANLILDALQFMAEGDGSIRIEDFNSDGTITQRS